MCVCVSNGLIVLQFLESLTEITSTPAAPVVLYNDIVSSNMLKYIFWYYKRADNDLIERITLHNIPRKLLPDSHKLLCVEFTVEGMALWFVTIMQTDVLSLT